MVVNANIVPVATFRVVVSEHLRLVRCEDSAVILDPVSLVSLELLPPPPPPPLPPEGAGEGGVSAVRLSSGLELPPPPPPPPPLFTANKLPPPTQHPKPIRNHIPNQTALAPKGACGT
jgi:hypothetical protein